MKDDLGRILTLWLTFMRGKRRHKEYVRDGEKLEKDAGENRAEK